MTESTMASSPMTKSTEERKSLLAQNVATAVASGGRIQSQSDFQAVIVTGKPVNHILHLILTVLTLGLWLIVWAILIVTGGEKRRMIAVDEFGNVTSQQVKA